MFYFEIVQTIFVQLMLLFACLSWSAFTYRHCQIIILMWLIKYRSGKNSTDVKFKKDLKNCFQLENTGIVFKARWFARPDINMGATII